MSTKSKLPNFEGTWKNVTSSSEEDKKKVRTIFEKLGKPELADGFLTTQASFINEHVADGDKWKSVVEIDSKKVEEVVWKIGEEYEATNIIHTKSKCTPRLEDDGSLVEEFPIDTSGGPKVLKTRTTFHGDEMRWNMKLDDVEYTQTFQKVSK